MAETRVIVIKVLDAETKEPLRGAAIKWFFRVGDAFELAGIVTASDGHSFIPNAPVGREVRVEVTYDGEKKEELLGPDTDSFNFEFDRAGSSPQGRGGRMESQGIAAFLRAQWESIEKALTLVPELRFVVGLTGVGAAFAIVMLSVGGRYDIAVFGLIAMLLGGVAVRIFAGAVNAKPGMFTWPIRILVWAATFFIVAIPACLFSSYFFCKPDMRELWGVLARCGGTNGHELACPEEAIRVPAGSYRYRTNHTSGDHDYGEREVGSFCLDQVEVSNARFAAVCGAAGCGRPQNPVPPGGADFAQFCTSLSNPAHGQWPVNCVSAAAAREFCRRAGGRLPLDVEWGWAARSSDGREYPWGSNTPDGTRLNYCDDGCAEALRAAGFTAPRHAPGSDPYPTLAPVHSYNHYGRGWHGLLNLSGNVAEWTEGQSQPMVRNGGWLDGTSQQAEGATVGNWEDFTTEWASEQSATFYGSALGFRCAYDLR